MSYDNLKFAWGIVFSANNSGSGNFFAPATTGAWTNYEFTDEEYIFGDYFLFSSLGGGAERLGFYLPDGIWIVFAKVPLYGGGTDVKTRLVRYNDSHIVQEVVGHGTVPAANTDPSSVANSSYIITLLELNQGLVTNHIGMQYYIGSSHTDNLGIESGLGSGTSEQYGRLEFYNVANYPPKVSFLGYRGWGFVPVCILKNEQANTTDAGSSSGSWTTLTVNNITAFNGRACVDLSSNQIKLLGDGSYYIHAKCQFIGTEESQFRFRQVVGGSYVAYGTSEYAPTTGDYVMSELSITLVNVDSENEYLFERISNTSGNDTDLGAAVSTGVETYFTATIWQVRRGKVSFRPALPPF
jgi:hypothetical protein